MVWEGPRSNPGPYPDQPGGSLIYDPVHSEDEDRYIALGESQRRRLLVVVFTDRDDRIRIISARVATRPERRNYEKGR